jgi:hypothetical protein
MSNDIATMFDGAIMAPIEGLDEDTLAVAGGARQNKRISIKGGVFRKYAGGKEIGTIEDRFMNVIFVKMAHNASRQYYDKGYKEGEKVSPVCWSSDSDKPDVEVKTPVSSSCRDCPNSVKGSGDNGTSTKCKLSWRTAIVLPNDPNGDVMQLVLPATSAFGKEDNGKWPFRPYIQHLASHNVSAGRVITRMAFDTKSPTPKVMFSPAGKVPDSDLQTIANQARSPVAEGAIKMSVYQMDTPSAAYVEVARPKNVREEVSEEDMPEPTKRESTKTLAPDEKNISDVVKKWSKK